MPSTERFSCFLTLADFSYHILSYTSKYKFCTQHPRSQVESQGFAADASSRKARSFDQKQGDGSGFWVLFDSRRCASNVTTERLSLVFHIWRAEKQGPWIGGLGFILRDSRLSFRSQACFSRRHRPRTTTEDYKLSPAPCTGAAKLRLRNSS